MMFKKSANRVAEAHDQQSQIWKAMRTESVGAYKTSMCSK